MRYLSYLMVSSIFFMLIAGGSIASNKDTVYTTVDVLPKLKKAKGFLYGRFFEGKLQYPNQLKYKGVEGAIWVNLVITQDGQVQNVVIEKSVHPLLDKQVKNMIEASGPWRPGYVNSQPVNTLVSFTVKCALSSKDKEIVKQLKVYKEMDNPPLFIIDNKKVSSSVKLEEYHIKKVKILNQKKAIEKYGDSAKNGAVIFSTQNK